MYLSLLNEKQKELFLGLVQHIASADGNYSDDEKRMIVAYCYEMDVSFDEHKKVKALEEILSELCDNSDLRIKRIIVFEAVGVAMADDAFHEKEKELISNIAEKFYLEKTFINECEEIIREYSGFQKRINRMILE